MNKFQILSEMLQNSPEVGVQVNHQHIKMMEFLLKNNNPTDSQLQQFAGSQGTDIDDPQAVINKLAVLFANFWFGGKSNEKHITSDKVDENELQMGIKVEYEHSPDFVVSRKIALDHLAEIPDYYTRLDKMEQDAGVDHH